MFVFVLALRVAFELRFALLALLLLRLSRALRLPLLEFRLLLFELFELFEFGLFEFELLALRFRRGRLSLRLLFDAFALFTLDG